jgi:hypothetical protein
MRNLLLTLPLRLQLLWLSIRLWWIDLVLRRIDLLLADRGEERVPVPLDFEELAVLYDEAHIPVLFDEAGGWAGNPWPEWAETIDYGESSVLS